MPQQQADLRADEFPYVTIQVPALPESLNPLFGGTDRWCHRILLNNVVEPLVRRSADGGYEPYVAQSMHYEAGGYRLVFKLREGIRFHDGLPLTSLDVKFTLEQLMGGRSVNSLLRIELDALKDVVTPDEGTVELHLSRLDYLLPGVLADIGILPAHRYRRAGIRSAALNTAPVGTGPYRVVASTAPDTLVLRRFAGYWGARPPVPEVHFKAIADPARALAALRNNEIDLLSQLHPEYYPKQIEGARFKRRFSFWRLDPNRPKILLMNLRRRSLKNRRVRLAIAQLVDRHELGTTLRNGLARYSNAPLWPLGPWYDQTLSVRPYDPETAGRLLDAAGWPWFHQKDRRWLGHPLRLRVLYARDTEAEQAALIVVKHLRASGFVTGADSADFGFLKVQLRRGRFDLAVVGLALRPTGDLWPYLHSDGQLNFGKYKNYMVDAVLAALRRTPSPAGRARLGQRLHGLLREDPPFVVLYAPIEMVVVNKRIKGPESVREWPRLGELEMVDPAHRGPPHGLPGKSHSQ